MTIKIVLLFAFWACLADFITGEKDMGPGLWSVLNMKRCEDHEKYSTDCEVNRKKMNKTHDGFSGTLKLDTELDDTIGIRIDICKYTDGGCKDFNKIHRNSFCAFVKEYAEDNFVSILTSMGIEPADCPLPPGEYTLKDYVFNYKELPDEAFYGMFEAKVFLLRGPLEIACIHLTAEFDENKDE